MRGNFRSAPGVYPGMFEQSILVQKRTSKPWSVLLSLAGELAGIGLLILLPLIWGDKLPMAAMTKIGVWLAPRPETPPPPTQPRPIAPHGKPRPFVDPTVFIPHQPPAHPVIFRDEAPNLSADQVVGLPTGDNIPGLPVSTFAQVYHPPAPPVAHVTPPVQHTAAPIRISHVDPAQILYKPMPVYPDLARKTRTQGVVKLLGVISTDGTIQNLRAVSGHPLLVPAALNAVSRWRFRPVILNGQPVEVEAPIEVTFTLQ